MSELISLTVRVCEFVLAVIALGLSASFIHIIGYGYGRIIYVLVISILTILYLIPVTLLCILRLIPFLVIYLSELVFFILWLIAFALVANDFGNFGSCTTDGNTLEWCREGKALIAFTLLLWLKFAFSLVLTSAFSLIPLLSSSDSIFSVVTLTSNNFVRGGIFLKGDCQRKDSKKDLEAAPSEEKEIDVSNEDINHTALEEVLHIQEEEGGSSDINHDISSSREIIIS
ncbi:uncharacterized protein RJT21DRAFT_125583 [Scheffersomyces amazonensis]|uniref:uncharacterized protein n=1 Tax=Scheffersomyces amazonensis TaxID=1078765 RepID=UPI00315DCA55